MILNLIDKDYSDIKYTIINFPDGQSTIEFDKDIDEVLLNGDGCVDIVSRLSSWNDIQLLLCANSFIRTMFFAKVILNISYLIGGRSDRRFNDFQPNYLRDVVAPVINGCGFDSIVVLDPHSDVTEAVLNNCCPISNRFIVEEALKSIDGTKCLMVPDGGALKKAYGVSDLFDEMIVCQKHRDIKTGEILSVTIPDLELHHEYRNFIVVDDCIDGGATFLNLASVFRDTYGDKNLYLIVTHGIFSKGTEELQKNYKEIFTTNSYKEMFTDGKVTVFDLNNMNNE